MGSLPVDRATDQAGKASGTASSELSSPYYHVRQRAVLGASDSVPQALELLDSSDHRVRSAAVAILSRALTSDSGQGTMDAAAIGDVLVAALVAESDDATLRAMARSAAPVGRSLLIRLDSVRSRRVEPAPGEAARPWREAETPVRQVVSLSELERRREAAHRAVLREVVRSDLRERLEEITSVSGSVKGFFRDPFRGLLALGSDVIPVLVELAANPTLSDSLRGLAVRALGEFEDSSVVPVLRRIHDHRKEVVEDLEARDPDALDFDGHLFRACRYILYRLGEAEPFHDRIEVLRRKAYDALKKRMPRQLRYFDYQWEIAYEWHQVKEYEIAVRRYRALLAQLEDYLSGFDAIGLSSTVRISYYNLACIHSILGDLDAAFDYLDSALEWGFSDLGWILLDRDLVNLRADSRFDAVRRRLDPDAAPSDAEGRAGEKK